MQAIRRAARAAFLTGGCILWVHGGASAQEMKVVTTPAGTPGAVIISGDQPAVPPGQPVPGQPPPGTPGAPPDGTPPATGTPAPGTPGAETPKPPPEPVKRPLEPATPPNPAELTVQPDADGKVSFSFKGQPWPAVLDWLADISGKSLQWIEAPPGYVDLTTRGRYTVDEVQNLINSVLHSNGFTLLSHGELLIVANLKTLDSSLVPRVTLEELDQRGAHEIVKVFFDLSDRLPAAAAAEEVKTILSPYAKVVALATTNRLDVLETAGNLRKLRELLLEEQSARKDERLVQEFKFRYARATDAARTLNDLLGLETKSDGPLTPEQAMMNAQTQMMQMQAQAASGQPAGAKPASSVFLTVNRRKNSIMVSAPGDKMALIEQAVKMIDVEPERSEKLLANLPKMQVYRLQGVSPETLAKVLNELGGLDPSTRLEVDTKNKAMIVYAPLIDHVTIQSVVDRIDGTGRRFEVVQLRILNAEYVAGSIELMMKPKKKEENNNRYRWYYDDYGQDEEEADGGMTVEADIERNRLLVRATDIELAEIRDLLVKLGELPAEGEIGDTVRVIPVDAGEETQRLLDRLKRVWPTVGGNPLEIDGSADMEIPSDEAAETPPRTNPTPTTGGKRPTKKPQRDELTAIDRQQLLTVAWQEETEADTSPQGVRASEEGELQFDQDEPTDSEPVEAADLPRRNPLAGAMRQDDEAGDDPTADQPDELPPVRISIGPSGIVISSRDAVALDRMEELLGTMQPQRLTYKLFSLRHTYAKDVVRLLKDAFKEQLKSSTTTSSFFYNPYSNRNNDEKKKTSLSKRRNLNFVADPVTNTILVQGADGAQLAEIESLIEFYDTIEPPDSQSVRRTQMVALRYATAKEVAVIVKDVYKDLLSPNDTALGGQQPQQQDQRNSEYSFLSSFLSDSTDENVPKFKGMLSVGIDERSNSVVLSAPAALYEDVESLIIKLDKAAAPTQAVVRVRRLKQPGVALQIQKAFPGVNGNGAPAAQPGQPSANPAGTPPVQPQTPGTPAVEVVKQ